MRIKAIIKGKVQGVFFRKNTKEKAQSLHLNGYVKNLPDGNTVEAVVEGSEEKVNEMIEFLKTGPSAADVKDIKIKQEPEQNLSKFEIRY